SRYGRCTPTGACFGFLRMHTRNLSALFVRPVRVVLLALPILGTFACTALLVAFLLAWHRGTGLLRPDNLFPGLISGLSLWLLLTIANAKTVRLEVPFEDRPQFLGNLHRQLGELGYEV